MILYSYFRSTAAYRVRIALLLKGIEHKVEPVNLFQGEQREDRFLAANPQGLVPALQLPSGDVIAQSGAILEWLEERYPEPALYPTDALERARHRALCQHITCDIHPLNNLRVLRYLGKELELDQASVDRWYAHWIQRGFIAIEDALHKNAGEFSLGDHPGMLELMLIPQVFNARRFKVDIDAFPAIVDLDARCADMPAFAAAHPAVQPDTPEAERPGGD